MFSRAVRAFTDIRTWLERVGRHSSARLATCLFAAIIVIITGLLELPIATASGERAPFVDALFTATSAVCVTGLTTVDTATYWSTFGQACIILATAVGGLRVMTIASV